MGPRDQVWQRSCQGRDAQVGKGASPLWLGQEGRRLVRAAPWLSAVSSLRGRPWRGAGWQMLPRCCHLPVLPSAQPLSRRACLGILACQRTHRLLNLGSCLACLSEEELRAKQV